MATANFNERHVADLYKECQTICFGVACCTLLGQCVKNMQAPYGRYWGSWLSWEQSVRSLGLCNREFKLIWHVFLSETGIEKISEDR